MKVVIADDEVNVCQLICNLVDWGEFGMDIVGIAHNGVEALELIKEHAPDLMVTDIRMPGCDGLEMISKAKQLNADLDFIIISGYRHFEYAQRAIRYGVYDYLLKPIKKDELYGTLMKMRDRYRQRALQLSLEEQQKLRMQSDMGRLRSRMFSDLLLQRESARALALELEPLNTVYHFNFSPGLFQIFIVKLDFPYKDYYQDTAAVLMDKVTQKLNGLLPECFDMQVSVIGSRAYGILNYAEDARHSLRRKLKAALDELLVQAGMFESITITIGMGEPVEEIGLLKRSLSEAQAATYRRLTEGTGILIEGGQTAPASDTAGWLVDFRRKIEAAVETLNQDTLTAALDELFARCKPAPGLSGQELIALVQDTYRACLDSFGNHYRKIDDAAKLYDAFGQMADLCSSANSLYDLLARELARLFAETLEGLRQTDAMPVRAAKQYIQENFSKPITLEEIAGVVGFNPSYFSTLFKKESGQNFLEYLTKVRIDRAKTLLKETNMTIAAICSEAGYSDLKHFSQTFKKITGLKPNEYRKLFA